MAWPTWLSAGNFYACCRTCPSPSPSASLPPAGRIIHADNSGFLPSFSLKFENIRFTNGQAEGLGGAFFNQGKLQVSGGQAGAAELAVAGR
jgi:hypothetical protein